MPIYEYLCESCGKVNERLQKVSDPPPARCDECGSKKLAKLVSRSAFQLKGGGWYSDLYATPKKKDGGDGGAAKPAAGDAAPASAAGTASTGGDAKPAAAPAKAAPAPGEKKKAGAAPTGSGPAGGKKGR